MRRALVIVVVGLLALGACGSDDDEGATATGATTGDTTGDTEAAAPVELAGEVNNEGTGDATGGDEFELEADDFYFGPTFVKVTSAQKLAVEVVNEGEAPHTFTIDELAIDQRVEPGERATVQVDLPAADAVAFYCKFHKDGGMQGAFYVREGASIDEPTVTSGGASGAAGY